MGMHDTDAEEVAAKLRGEALKALDEVADWVSAFREALVRHEHGAFPSTWYAFLDERMLNVRSNIDRANGAVLVRAVEER